MELKFNMKPFRHIPILALSVAVLFSQLSATASIRDTFVPQPGIAVLDMTTRNTGEAEDRGDYSRQLYSAQYICDIAGNPYTVSTDLAEAMKEKVILLSSDITASSFSEDELRSLIGWVRGGGTLVSPAIRSVSESMSPLLSELFGINAASRPARSYENILINWNQNFAGERELSYFDEDEERETSIGTIKTYAIRETVADVLASFPDGGGAAVTRNKIGKGAAYLVGLLWRDVIQRSQLNKDSKASRHYNNGFEPSADIWAFFLRSVYAKAVGVSAWKFTAPDGYLQVLVPTHDCDSRTAYDAMHYMGEYEKSVGLKGHYFLTTHYYSDKENFGHSYLSAFYNEETIPKAAAILADGHTVGSHSVCHFPDFNLCRNTDVVTPEEYAMRATCTDGTSTGASTWAEIVMSKQILERDLHNGVRSFRSGHLCVNPDFNKMLETGDYEFSSCYTGGDLLSEFPFFGRYDNDWSGKRSSVLQMPLHISDVYNNKPGYEGLNDENWDTHVAVDEWFEAMRKLRGNYASAILLIHPNREWKMTLEKRLIDRLDLTEVGLYNFEDYGDFWKKRFATDFQYCYLPDAKQVIIVTDLSAVDKGKMTFAIDCDKPVETAYICNSDFTDIRKCDLKQLSPDRYLVLPDNFSSGIDGIPCDGTGKNRLTVYPSITSGELRVDGKGPFRIFSLVGSCVMSVADNLDSRMVDVSRLPSGYYIIASLSSGASAKIARR